MKPFLYVASLCALLLVSGCWDRMEINDLAFISGSSFDLTDKGESLLSVQIAVPSSGQGPPAGGDDGQHGKFIVLSATGENASVAFERIQNKSSRKLFTAHRSVIFVSEAVAKQGIFNILDVFTHDPRQRLKTYIMLVKGGEAREILQIRFPFEQVPVEAIKEMEGLRAESAVTLRDFFIDTSSEGINPNMGIIEHSGFSDVKDENKHTIFKLSGTALFKDLKLAGLLSEKETNGFLWATGKMKSGRISAFLPGGAGNVSMVVSKADRMIVPEINGDKIKFNIKLNGVGPLVENNSKLEVFLPRNLMMVQRALEQSVEEQARIVIDKMQKQFKVDCLGLGQVLYRDHPKQWKAVRSRWDFLFPQVEVSVKAKITLSHGMSHTPLQLKQEEVTEWNSD